MAFVRTINHMDQDLAKKLDALEAKAEETRMRVAKIQRYFFWTLVVTMVVVVLPLIGLAFVIPQFINTYTNLGI